MPRAGTRHAAVGPCSSSATPAAATRPGPSSWHSITPTRVVVFSDQQTQASRVVRACRACSALFVPPVNVYFPPRRLCSLIRARLARDLKFDVVATSVSARTTRARKSGSSRSWGSVTVTFQRGHRRRDTGWGVLSFFWRYTNTPAQRQGAVFLQQLGRIGRDGEACYGILCFNTTVGT